MSDSDAPLELELNCWVIGGQNSFSVRICNRQKVHELKTLINAENRHTFGDTDALSLDLWKVFIPDTDSDAMLRSISTPDAVNAAVKLQATRRLSSYFSATPADEHIHIIVQRPTSTALLSPSAIHKRGLDDPDSDDEVNARRVKLTADATQRRTALAKLALQPTLTTDGLKFTTVSRFVPKPTKPVNVDPLAKERRRRLLELTKQSFPDGKVPDPFTPTWLGWSQDVAANKLPFKES